jgi:hypothetical protein
MEGFMKCFAVESGLCVCDYLTVILLLVPLLGAHLKKRLELTSDKIRFQGCAAARHDDIIPLQNR